MQKEADMTNDQTTLLSRKITRQKIYEPYHEVSQTTPLLVTIPPPCLHNPERECEERVTSSVAFGKRRITERHGTPKNCQ